MNRNDLHTYQLTAEEHILKYQNCGLFLDMGLGKTVVTLSAIKKLMFEELDIMNALVIAPKRVAENVWTDECRGWDHLSDFKISKIAGTQKQRKAALAVKADIYLIGRDNVTWLCGLFGGSMLPFDMLVVDESSSFKSPKSLRFKALRSVQPSFKRVVILSGTPAPNGLIDLWSQMYLLDRGERLGKYITNFRSEYFRPGQTNGAIVYNYKILPDSEKRIHKKIDDICMSMKAKDYLDLPGRVVNDIKIVFPEELQKRYDDFEKEQVMRLFIEDGESKDVSVVNAAALTNKLLQFANGAVYDEEKNWYSVHDLKLDAAEELIEAANGKPVLIAWTYRHDLYRLQKRLKAYKPRELKTEKDISDWNNGKIQVMLMHPASGGHGLNLQHGGSTIIWFGQTWSLELYNQFNARLDRQGQKEITIIHRLIAHKTYDNQVVKSLARKNNSQEWLLKALKTKIRNYIEDFKKL